MITASRRSVRKSVVFDKEDLNLAELPVSENPMDDLVDLTETRLSNVTDVLNKRFKSHDIYTNVDTTFLLSINPYKHENIYTDTYIECYANADLDAEERYPPHLYEFAEQTYRNMLKTCQNQSVFITGEGGSGKSMALWEFIKYLTVRTTFSDPAPPGYSVSELTLLADRLLSISKIISVFGCAKTSKGNNTSKCGVNITMFFNVDGVARGARINPFCFDASVIVSRREGEGTFNTFSYLFAVMSPEGQKRYLIDQSGTYSFYPADEMKSNVDLEDFRRTMMMCGISLDDQDDIFSILSAILHLGNVQFIPSGEATRMDLKSIRALRTAANLLEISESDLRTALTTGRNGRNYNSVEASEARDSLAKTLYRRLFFLICSKLNQSLAAGSKEDLFELNILDMPGHEKTRISTFEQFKVNFVDEIIYAIRNQFLFVQEQMEYEEDGIAWDPIPFNDTSMAVQIMAGDEMTDLTKATTAPRGKNSIAALMNPRRNESDVASLIKGLRGLVKADAKKSLIRDIDERSSCFTLHHYFGDIKYDAQSFVIDNMEPVRYCFLDLLKSTTLPCLKESLSFSNILDDMDPVDPLRPATAMTRFYQSFQTILRQITMGSPWFIQCVKSNARQIPGLFDRSSVEETLKTLSIPELIHMRQRSYQVRMTFVEFYDRYCILLKKRKRLRNKSMTITDLQPTCADIIQVSMSAVDHQPISGAGYQIGIHHVYLTSLTHNILEYLIQSKEDWLATEIQRIWRGYKSRKDYRRLQALNRKRQKSAVLRIEEFYINHKTRVSKPQKRSNNRRHLLNAPVSTPTRTSSNSKSAWDTIELDVCGDDEGDLDADIVNFFVWSCSVLREKNQLDPRNIQDSFIEIIRDGAFLLKLAAYIYPNLPSPEELLQETEDAEQKFSLFLDVCEKFTGIEEKDLFEISDILGSEVNLKKILKTLNLFKQSINADSDQFKTLKQAAVTRESMFTPVDVTDLLRLKRQRIDTILELVKSEEVFVHCLRLIVEFKRKLVEKNVSVSPGDLDTIFGNVDSMLEMHENFILRTLKSAMSAGSDALDQIEIGLLFRNLMVDMVSSSQENTLEQIYLKYFNNSVPSQIILINNTSAVFKTCLEMFAKSSGGMSLADFLLLPLQRPERYVDLLKEIEKFTPSSHSDRSHISRSIVRMKAIADQVADVKKRVEEAVLKQRQMRKPSTDALSHASSARDRSYTNILANIDELYSEERKFICKGSVWEVVNTNLVKERSLFLFSDLLIIAKEVQLVDKEESRADYPVYDVKYLIKTILSINSVNLRLDRDEDPFDLLLGSPVMNKALAKFEHNPKTGIQYLISKGLFSAQPSSIAQFLFRTNSLNKRQVGRFIGSPDNYAVLCSFLECFDFTGMRVDESLRVFLSSFRLPGEPKIIDCILEAFAKRYHANNVTFASSYELILKLVFATLMLNADLHRKDNSGDSRRMSFLEFSEKFHAHDKSNQISDSILQDIYGSIRQEKIAVASDNDESDRSATSSLNIVFGKVPFRLTVKEYSKPITVTIPIPDPDFVIKLFPQHGLKCFPSVLSFQKSNSATFRIISETTGRKSIAFLKGGTRAHLYSNSNIPTGKPIIVEPSFMRNVFQIKAKERDPITNRRVAYMFSVANETQKMNWAHQIDSVIKANAEKLQLENAIDLDSAAGSQIMQDFYLGENGAVVVPSTFKIE